MQEKIKRRKKKKKRETYQQRRHGQRLDHWQHANNSIDDAGIDDGTHVNPIQHLPRLLASREAPFYTVPFDFLPILEYDRTLLHQQQQHQPLWKINIHKYLIIKNSKRVILKYIKKKKIIQVCKNYIKNLKEKKT